jgi:hypothetical protein
MSQFKPVIIAVSAGFSFFLFQLRTSYPEDKFLKPVLWFLVFACAFAGLMALLTSRRKARKKIKESGTAAEINVEPKQYFTKVGNHEIEIEASEVKRMKRDGYEVIER